MPVAVDLPAEVEGLLAELACLRQIPLGLADSREVAQSKSDGTVALAVDLLEEVESLLAELTCLRQIPLVIADCHQVVQGGSLPCGHLQFLEQSTGPFVVLPRLAVTQPLF